MEERKPAARTPDKSIFVIPPPVPPQQQVSVVPPASPAMEWGTRIADFAIRAIRARAAPAVVLATAKTGLAAIFGTALLGVKATAGSEGGGWLAEIAVTGLDTGQMLIMAGTVVVLAGMDLYAYVRRLRQDEKAQAWVMDSARDPTIPAHQRERLIDEAIAAARSRR